MADYETLGFEERDGVAWIRMDRPDEMNALNLPMAKDLCRAATYCTVEKGVRAVVLTGTGKAFCAGGDVKKMVDELNASGRPDLFLRELAMYLHSFIAEIARMPKPVMAAVNGTAAGAGFSMSLACDMSVASEAARFVLAYTNIGLIPDGSGTYFLTRLVGVKKALEIAFLNDPIGAEEALGLGIVNQVLPAAEFEQGVAEVAGRLARGPVGAYGRAKAAIRRGLSESLESQMENERQGLVFSSLQAEFREGVTAFMEKRKPDFESVS